MRRIVLLLALVAIVAAVLVSGAIPAVAQGMGGMNCGWWWDWWYGWYWACY